MSQEHALLVVTMDIYADKVRAFIRDGTTTHRSLIAVMMEAGLAKEPDEASLMLDLLAATRRIRRAETALANQASGLYLPN